MAVTWNVLKPRLTAALVDAFDENGFSQMLEFACQQKLGHLTADRIPFPQKVYEVMGSQSRAPGWKSWRRERKQLIPNTLV